MSTRSYRSPEYQAWDGMIQRCHNPNSVVFVYYGARGISVCDAWRRDFATFFRDMGARPPGTSIDRIDNDGNYELGNCRWATRKEQMRNTRYTRMVEWNGERLCVREAAAKYGLKEMRIYYRVHKHGVSHQEAFEHYIAQAGASGLSVAS